MGEARYLELVIGLYVCVWWGYPCIFWDGRLAACDLRSAIRDTAPLPACSHWAKGCSCKSLADNSKHWGTDMAAWTRGSGKSSRMSTLCAHYVDNANVVGLGKQEMGYIPDVLVQGVADNIY